MPGLSGQYLPCWGLCSSPVHQVRHLESSGADLTGRDAVTWLEKRFRLCGGQNHLQELTHKADYQMERPDE